MVGVCTTVALCAGVRVAAGPHPIDDAYITFRHARNVVDGVGLVFNSGEHVLGTTTPLWALLLAAATRVTGLAIPALALGFSILTDAATTFLLASEARRHTGSAALGFAAACAFALAPTSIQFATGGMETSLFTFLVVLAFVLRERAGLWPLAVAAATLTRPEGLLIAAVFTLDCARRGGLLVAARSAALYIALLVPWSAFAWWYYGSPIPHTVIAKSAGVYALDRLRQVTGTFRTTALLAAPELPFLGVIALLVVRRDTLKRLSPLVLLVPGALLAFHVASAARGTLSFGWYLVPLLPWLLLLVVIGASQLGRYVKGPTAVRLALTPAVGGLLVLSQILVWNIDHDSRIPPEWPWPPSTGLPLGREQAYLEAASYLDANLPAGSTVAAPEIGAIGWGAPHVHILDTVGLVSPEALRYYPLPRPIDYGVVWGANNAIPAALIRQEQPQYVLTLEFFARPILTYDPTAFDGYTLERSWPATAFGSTGLMLYRKVAS